MADVFEKLIGSVAFGRTRHAYLLTGSDPEHTAQAARKLASQILYGRQAIKELAEDPDYLEINGGVAIARFRDEIQPEIYREAYTDRGRTVAFLSANLLSQMVQNAMLKVLEEPPEATHFILTGNEYGILPTIRSRCTVVRCPSPGKAAVMTRLMEERVSEMRAAELAAMSGCVTGRALRLNSDEAFFRMRKELYAAFISALNGRPVFGFTRAKREREDWAEAAELLLLFAHDMLSVACGAEPEHCPDFASEIKKLGLHFTIGDIGCIIDRITDAARRTATNASGAAAFDRLFAEAADIGRNVKN